MTDHTQHEPLRVYVSEDGRSRADWTICHIGHHLSFSPEPLASYFFADWEPIAFDALLLAAAVEFCDKHKRRPALRWWREFELRLPVHDVAVWTGASESLHEALELLTGDRWRIEFAKRRKSVTPPRQGQFNLSHAGPFAIIPFSEGLDSRAVAGLMAKEYGDRLIRVRLGPKENDRPVDAAGRMSPFTAVPYKVSRGEYRFPEVTARSRGFKFALLSGLAAYLAKADRVFVTESGQGAIGPSLLPVGQAYEDYRNHPVFTQKMSVFLKALFGTDIRFEFPRLWHTKGETLRDYVAACGSNDWATTRSCWQDNRNVSVDHERRQCGVCAACMLRRLSVHAAGLTEAPETYIWEDLRVASFERGAAKGFKKISAQRHYAIAGALHLDHLAWVRHSQIHASRLDLNIHQLALALGQPKQEVRAGLIRMLSQHEKEWKAFMEFLGSDSFVSHWTARKHANAA